MKRAFVWIGSFVILCFLGSAFVGEIVGSGVLHPARKRLSNADVARAQVVFTRDGVSPEELDVRASDGVEVRGWKVRAAIPNGDWIMLFHGQSDNRVGTIAYAGFLLRAGYSVVMMDSRAHGASDGSMATYGWKERWDTRDTVSALYASDAPRHLYALGESMGAAIALQSAAIEPRIAGVIAEAPFSDLREVTYDYAGLRLSPWLGKTLFRPASIMALHVAEKEGGFQADQVSPEKAVAARAFPVLLICGTLDRRIPCRHAERIFRAAKGPKQLWIVPGAQHTSALGVDPVEFKRRVLAFLAAIH